MKKLMDMFRGERVESGDLQGEALVAQGLMLELRDSGNQDAAFVLNLAEEKKLPFAYIPDPVSPRRPEGFVALAVAGANLQVEDLSGLAFVLVINGRLVNKKRVAKDRGAVLSDVSKGLALVTKVIRGEYLQGKVAMTYPYEHAGGILDIAQISTRQ